MLVVTSLGAAMRIAALDVRRLVTRRYKEICNGEAYDYDLHGQMIVVEPGDSLAALERASGCPIAYSFVDDVRFGDPHFSPSFEALEEHPGVYEMVFVLTDAFGVVLFIPKDPGIDAELLALCAAYAIPASQPV